MCLMLAAFVFSKGGIDILFLASYVVAHTSLCIKICGLPKILTKMDVLMTSIESIPKKRQFLGTCRWIVHRHSEVQFQS